jgi:serine/threonine protein kinase
LFNLRHPLIAPLIGFVFPVESARRRALKTARLHASGGSLADVLADPAGWWTPTAKAKAVVGIALALRFAHRLGLLHGVVKAGNILFDADRRIQIADFSSIRLETGEVESFSGEKWTPTADVWAFASLLSEIAIGAARALPVPVPARVPLFFLRMITDGRLPESRCRLSFADILGRLKVIRFEIVAGVDSEEVSAFVARVESAEQSGHWE